jgi:glutamate synthase domain-containing protein 3
MSNNDYVHHAEDCDCGKDCTFTKEGVATIRADGRDTGKGPLHYKTLNCAIRKAIASDYRTIIIEEVMGQRYIGATASGSDLRIMVHGTPGNSLGAFLNGPTIEVLGNAQDMTGNTMNSGKIIVHGNAWDVTGLSARGGTIMIKGSSGYRVGIHMKEFGHTRPSLVIGGTVKDYLGEYMAGGTILVLGLRSHVESPVGHNIGAGIHGGRIYVRGKVSPDQLGPGAVISQITEEDSAELTTLIEEFEGYFGEPVGRDYSNFVKINPSSSRPFSGYYDKTNI